MFRMTRPTTDGAGLLVWLWRSGPDHRALEVQPPTGVPPAEASPGAAPVALWDAFATDDPAALRALLDTRAPIDNLPARWTGPGAAPVGGRLDGRPCDDAAGRFAGYHGAFSAAAPSAPSRPRSPDSAAPPAAEADSFRHAISHDLRAPLRVIEGFTKIVKEDYGALLDRVGNDHLDRVLGAAARMNAMIDALVTLSKLSSQPLAAQPVNLSQLAGYVVDDLRRAAPAREVEIAIEPDLHVRGDPAMLRTLIENLLGNAWKFTGKTAPARIGLHRDPQRADAFVVQDNGAGFDMRFADRLFGVFQRLHSASDFPGAGVGLAAVHRIVRRHGGEVRAEAEVNGGARVRFSLPQGDAAPG
jgi:signal transduction histidine kinase